MDFADKARTLAATLFLCALAGWPCALGALGQSAVAENDLDRQHALEIYRSFKLVEAMPLLEELAARYPKDPVIMESWGVSVVGYAQTLTDPKLQRKARIRARTILLSAQALGDNSPLLVTMLAGLPEDGSVATFSNRAEVDKAMQVAEADFARGDLDKAREGYLRALLLEPKNYEAALFIGDAYFKQHQFGSAGDWFANAIRIDSNRETAYRYWGDALIGAGKNDEARSKFMEAVIAEPYNRSPWQALAQWAQRNKVTLTFLRLEDKTSITSKSDGRIEITVDPSRVRGKDDPTGLAWVTYAAGRGAWRQHKFKQEFPEEAKYRHSLKEEAECLHEMLVALREQKDFQDRAKDIDPSLLELSKIDDANLLEPFVLLNRADAEITQDYATYRNVNRDKIRSYLDQFVVPHSPRSSLD